VAFSQVSTNFDLHWNVFSSGGGSRSSSNANISDSLGQWSFGPSTSSLYHVVPGFWAGKVEKNLEFYIPLVQK